MRRALSLLLMLLLCCIGCNDEPTPPEEKPEGYQEDIPWPSLADSPWPMNHHDPQSTGRSKYLGPKLGIESWAYEENYLQTGIVIDYINNIWFGSLKALTEDGTVNQNINLKWQSAFTPLIDSKNNIYTASRDTLFSISQNAQINWRTKVSSILFYPMVNIDLERNLYVVDGNKSLYAINSNNGEVLWSLNDNRFNSGASGISFSPDGHTLYIPGEGVTVLAVDIISKIVKWYFGNISMRNAPVVDSYGNVYLLPRYANGIKSQVELFSVNQYGELNWSFNFVNSPNALYNANTPTIDKEGNIYFADDTLYSISFKGSLNWKKPLQGFTDCPIICDSETNIYVGTMATGDSFSQISISCFNKSGNKLWSSIKNDLQVGGSPAIGKNKDLYFPSWRSKYIYRFQ